MSPRPWRRSAAAGFTLVEMAIVVCVAITLATLAAPSWSDMLARHRVKAAAETLAADLADARMLAAQRGQDVHVAFFGAGAEACWSLSLADGCDCRIAQSCRVKATTAANFRGVELADPRTAHFAPDGTGSGSAELRSAQGHRLRVEVALLGRPRICAPGGSDPRYPTC